MTTTDAVVAFDVAKNIVERGSVATSGDLIGTEAIRGRGGQYYSPFGLLQSLYDVPFYLIGTALADLGDFPIGKPDTVPKALVSLSQTLLAALVVWQFFRLAAVVSGSLAAALPAGLTIAFGSLLWPYSQFGFGQPLACITLLLATAQAYTGIRLQQPSRLTWSGVWLGLSVLSRHEMALAIIPLGVWVAGAGSGGPIERRQRLVTWLPGVTAGMAIWLVYNAARFGHPLDTGHLRDPVPGFGSPIAEGLMGLLFSPGASLFVYSPFAAFGVLGLVWLARRDKAAAALFGSLSLAYVVFYATLGNWMGGRSYGGRYLLIILPYLGIGWAVVLGRLTPRARGAVFGVVAAAGILVQLPGVLVDYAKVSQQAFADAPAPSIEERQWHWRTSSLVLNARALPPAVSDNIAFVLGARTPPRLTPPAGDDDRSFSQQFAFSLDLWWLYLFYMGVLSPAALALVCGGFAVVAGFCALRLRVGWRAIPSATVEGGSR